MKADDLALACRRRLHELTDRADDVAEGAVVSVDACFELVQFPRDFLVRRERLPQRHERPHDVEAGLHRAIRVQHGRGHDGAVLGEDVREVFAMLPAALL